MDYNRIYAYTTIIEENKEWIGKRKGKGLIKIGQTSIDTKTRVRQQLQGSPSILKENKYKILFDEEAIDVNGKYFKDTDVFKWLKLLGAYRIPKTEWFECTLEEIKEAFKNTSLKLKGNIKPYKDKNTVEKRGSRYNKEEAAKEKELIKGTHSLDRIINIMRIYPEATSIVKIANKFVEYYKIKQYSSSTVSGFLGNNIKYLERKGYIVNEGDMQHPYLKLLKSDFNNFKLINEQKPKLSIIILRSIMNNSKDGVTLEELQEKYNIDGTYVIEYLSENYIKIKERNSYNRQVNRYIHKKFYKEESYKIGKKVPYSPIKVLEINKLLKGKSKELSTGSLLAGEVAKEANISINELRAIISDNFSKLVITPNKKNTLRVTYKSNVDNCDLSKIAQIQLAKDINDLKSFIGSYKNGVTTSDIRTNLKWSNNKIRKCLLSKLGLKNFIQVGDIIILPKNYNDELKNFSIEVQKKSLKYNITPSTILDIIKKNPNCSTSDIEKELLKTCNINSKTVNLHSLVVAFKRYLERKGYIVFIDRVERAHVKDDTYTRSALSPVALDRNEIINFIESNRYGANTMQVHSFIGGIVARAQLYRMLGRIPEVQKVRVCSEKRANLYEVRWFKKGKINLREHEDVYDCV